jgi:hypothetical protein
MGNFVSMTAEAMKTLTPSGPDLAMPGCALLPPFASMAGFHHLVFATHDLGNWIGGAIVGSPTSSWPLIMTFSWGSSQVIQGCPRECPATPKS